MNKVATIFMPIPMAFIFIPPVLYHGKASSALDGIGLDPSVDADIRSPDIFNSSAWVTTGVFFVSSLVSTMDEEVELFVLDSDGGDIVFVMCEKCNNDPSCPVCKTTR